MKVDIVLTTWHGIVLYYAYELRNTKQIQFLPTRSRFSVKLLLLFLTIVFPVESAHGCLQRSPAGPPCMSRRGKKGKKGQDLAPPDQLSFLLVAPPSSQGEWSVRQSNLQVKRQTSSLPFLSYSLSLPLHASPSVALACSTCSEQCGWAHTTAASLALPLVSERCAVAPSIPFASLPLSPSHYPLQLMNV